jgi:hypothetical protein
MGKDCIVDGFGGEMMIVITQRPELRKVSAISLYLGMIFTA